ncbi:TEPSIN, adaptor related protein complex 4 accessory protein [Turdus rufiventris]|nr:TEPSIN, adaptor related protein complex 4 accessory protein [Turdus rufiventris]
MAVPLRDRLSFLSRLPVLLRGTADDDSPCPGYLFEEIAKISHESPGSSQCLLEHLLTRLQSSSCHVKLKVLKILLHTCSQGSPQFVLQLKRNASFIREAAVFSGPPDPLHGNSLNQKVRAAAQDLASILFSDAPLPQPLALPTRSPAPAGMGSSPSPCGSLQGFGFSSDKSGSVSHQPGLAGGGWEEADSGHSSRESSQGNERSRTSDSGSKSGSDSRSGASRELSHGPERCGLLNCEVVLELLGRALEDPSDSVRMRSMCAISALGCSDLLSPEQIFAVTRQRLQHLSQGSPGPVANRATKMLRQFEALCRAQPSPRAPRPPPAPSVGSARDLLMDIPALASESFLTPLSPALTPAAPTVPGEEPGVASEPPGQPGAVVPACPCEQDGGSRLAGDTAAPSLSLFAGMELVARPGTVLRPHSPPVEPQTPSQPQDGGTDTEGTLQPSAFAFLNM